MNTVDSVRDKARRWLFEEAAPFWAEKGVHPDGMFVEAFTQAGEPIDEFRRLRVQARQIFSFCEIGRLGWTGPWREKVEAAVAIFVVRGVTAEQRFLHSFDNYGEIKDNRFDLYDQAFGLFALAHAGDALGRKDLFEAALGVLDTLDNKWARPQGGYWEGQLESCPPYRQNPHMHLFEAGLAHYRFSGDPRWREFATRIGVLFKTRFQNSSIGAVTEYFDENWRPLAGRDGEIVEPGHCFEWAWLFDVACDPVHDCATADQLSNFARRWGVCPHKGLAINEITTTGEVVDGRARLWPQTERLKAAITRAKRTGEKSDRDEVVAAYLGLERYFAGRKPGLWAERIDVNGLQIEGPAPASSLYHIVCALSELIRAE